MKILIFFIGLVIGCFLGFFVSALCVAASANEFDITRYGCKQCERFKKQGAKFCPVCGKRFEEAE